jgi:hypothetical protein
MDTDIYVGFLVSIVARNMKYLALYTITYILFSFLKSFSFTLCIYFYTRF